MKNSTKFNILFIVILITLLSCVQKTNKEQEQVNISAVPLNTEITNKGLSKGFQLLESSCFSCHSPDINIKNKVAPTIADIKRHYLTEGVTKKVFTNDIIAFVNDPVEEKAKIPLATKHFGLMPKFNFSKEKLAQIANYIYSTDLENTNWFTKQYELEKQKHKIKIKELSYVDLGKHYAMSTKSVLGKNLKSAIKNKGTKNALEFCYERAYPLTDSMAITLNTKIKRVSDKTRNPLNIANEYELKYIDESKKTLTQGKNIKPKVQEINGKIVCYYPIITNKMCLQCHGKPNIQIQTETLEKLNFLYPKDLAKDYAENQLRGIWVVEMDKK